MLLQLSHQHSTIMLLLASYLSGDGEWGVFSVVLIRSQSQAGTVSLSLGGMTCSVLLPRLQLQFWAQHFFLSLLQYWAESRLPLPSPPCSLPWLPGSLPGCFSYYGHQYYFSVEEMGEVFRWNSVPLPLLFPTSRHVP